LAKDLLTQPDAPKHNQYKNSYWPTFHGGKVASFHSVALDFASEDVRVA